MFSHFKEDVTLVNRRDDFACWHRGRKRYAVWVIEIDEAIIERRVRVVRQHLADVLLADYRRQSHVTIGVCGFPASVRHHEDDFLPVVLVKQLQALHAVHMQPFSIEITGPDSFEAAPFLHVVDCDQGIDRLRVCLGAASREYEGFSYTPHLTVGLYGGVCPRSLLFERLERFKILEPLRQEVRCLHWASYDAIDIGGPLRVLATFDLQRKRVRWQTTTPWV